MALTLVPKSPPVPKRPRAPKRPRQLTEYEKTIALEDAIFGAMANVVRAKGLPAGLKSLASVLRFVSEETSCAPLYHPGFDSLPVSVLQGLSLASRAIDRAASKLDAASETLKHKEKAK